MRESRLTNEQLAAMVASGHPQSAAIEALLIERNTNLLWTTVNKCAWTGVDRDELYSLAAEGFLLAVRKFDPKRASKLSTSAVLWMRQKIGRYCEESVGLARIPSHVWPLLAQVNALGGWDGSNQELAGAVGVSAQRLATARKAEMMRARISLDAIIPGGDRTTQVELRPCPAPTPEEVALHEDTLRRVSEALGVLTPRERTIIEMRFWQEMTLDQCGAALGLSRERIRQSEAVAIKKLRGALV